MNVISLYKEIENMGASFYHWDLSNEQVATIEIGRRYGVFMDFDTIETAAEETVLVAHEGGHISTGSTHQVNSPYEIIKQHENHADKWAIKKLIPKDELDKAVSEGHTEVWDLADYFNVTEEFIRKAVCWYTRGNLSTELYF